MRHRIVILAAALCLVACSEKTFYLSPKGNDLGKGSFFSPWASPEQAIMASQAYLREHPDKDVTLIVKSGEYQLQDSLFIDGSKYKGEFRIIGKGKTRPVFSGEKAISGWMPVTDEAVLANLPEGARGRILMSDLKAQGVTDYGTAVSDTNRIGFYCNGKKQELSRWPNKGDGFLYAGKAVGEIENAQSYMRMHNTLDGILEYKDARISCWKEEKEPCALGYWHFNWSEDYQKMDIDTLAKTITLLGKPHHYGYRDGCRFAGINLLCELDKENEFYLDRSEGKLYWYAPVSFDQDVDKTVLTMFNEAFMLVADNCNDLEIKNIDFCGSRGGAIRITAGDEVSIKHCGIRRFAQDAIIVKGGEEFEMKSCEIEELDCGGMKASGGDRKTLRASGFEVKDCIFKDLALFRPTYKPAINFSGCGMHISHNLFDGNASSALRLEGNDILVEYNEFCNLVQESEDQGGIDMFYNFSYRGNVIRYNYWHDIGLEGMSEAAAIRFDDIISGTEVYGNVFENCGTKHFGAVQIHGGMDNMIHNNLFFNCTCAISCSPWDEAYWLKQYEGQKKKLEEVDFYGPLYKSHYPEIVPEKELFAVHNKNHFKDNLLINVPEPTRRAQYSMEEATQSVIDNGNDLSYYLQDEVLASYGLKKIPFEKIGPKRK